MRTDNLRRFFRRGSHEIHAVDGVSIDVYRGEFLGIVGSSGSGKSTLLNLLAGLDTPTSGEIVVENTRLGRLNRRQLAAYRAKRVGMVFQSFNLLPHLTAEQNVAMALAFNNTPRGERLRIAREMLEQLGLGDRLDHQPSDLSGGEQQRVAVARALVKQPDILFADEPTGNLDQENADQIASLLTDLNRDGLTIVMVSHDLELVKRCAERKIRMHYGRIEGRIDGPVQPHDPGGQS
ncbi:ATP-binding cassette domain-containing protein [candidate division GN15 bacterium]|nr:ATP-binding cassette domain-containing protein [candidate division GN15 bacterium]